VKKSNYIIILNLVGLKIINTELDKEKLMGKIYLIILCYLILIRNPNGVQVDKRKIQILIVDRLYGN